MQTLTLVGIITAEGGDARHGGFTPSFISRRDAMRGAWEPYVQATPLWKVKYEREGSDRRQLLDYYLARPQYSHLLWLDTDVLATPDTLEQLLGADVPVVGAAFRCPKDPTNVLYCPKWPLHTGLQRVDLGCIGATLMTRAAAEALRGWPWVDLNGSDTHFWHRLRDLGIPTHVQTDVVLTMEPRQ